MTSPGSRTPTLAASTRESIVPAQTGMPAGRPVRSAPASVIVPAVSHGSSTRGSVRPGPTSTVHSSTHVRSRGSNIGLLALEPHELGPDRLMRDARQRALDDLLVAIALDELVDLGVRPRIVVEDRAAQRAAPLIGQQRARPYTA